MESDPIDFRHLFNSLPGLYLILDPELIIIAVNDAYNKATMTTRESIVGHHIFEVFPDNPDDLNADGVSNLSRSLNYVRKNKKAHSMAFQKYDIRRPDGTFEERYWSPINSPILNTQGELIQIIHKVEDVTQFVHMQNQQIQTSKIAKKLQLQVVEMEAEILQRSKEVQQINIELEKNIQQLIDSENKFQKAFQASAAGMTITKLADSSYLDVNNTFTKMVGYEKDEIIGKTSKELGLIMDFDRLGELLEELRLKGSVQNFEMTICNRFGVVMEIMTSIETILLNNEKYAINIIYDITKRKNAEKQLNVLNKELEAFSYSISHDLRAPLRTLSNYAESLIEKYAGQVDEDANRIFSNIHYYTQKMGILIDDLLAFSHLGKKELLKITIDLNELVEGVLSDLEKSMPHQAKIIVHPLPNIQADYGLFHQLFFNLLSNAIKYSSKVQDPKVEVGCEKSDDELIFYVKDNGIGFSMDKAEKLFEVFHRLDTSEGFEGTGVGLAIVHRIISKHGGRIWAEAKINQGAVFYFSLKNDMH